MIIYLDRIKSKKWVRNVVKMVKYFPLRYAREKERLTMLRKAREEFSDKYSINVSKRSGYYVFHNKNNSLINRGESYEPDVQQALIALVSLDKLRNIKTVFADVGANIGLHTVFLKNIYSDLEIIAFDPSPFSWMYLDLTLKFNNLSNVKLEKFALSDNNGKVAFHNWGEESSADSIKNTNRVHGVKPRIIEVETKKMDDVIYGSSRPTVIKMDCEGAELSILRGAIDTFSENKPLILLEIHPVNKKAYNVTNEDIFSFLEKINYKILSLKFDVLDFEKFSTMQNCYEENYIILPNEMLGLRSEKV